MNVIIFASQIPDRSVVRGTWSNGFSLTRGIHIHDKPVPSDGNCTPTGVHFDRPERSNHGSEHSVERHLGDLGNTKPSNFSKTFNTRLDDMLIRHGTLSVVLHEKVDDLGLGGDAESLLTGNSGGRFACSNLSLAYCLPWEAQELFTA